MAPPKPPQPPAREHKQYTKHISDSEAQQHLAAFVNLAKKHPHLHPDSYLTTNGVTFATDTGPNGGIALHHLARIEAGLRGEALEPETHEELEAKFGPQSSFQPADDARLDALISETERRKQRDLRKGKRSKDEIDKWADETSSNYGGWEQGYGDGIPKEVESFANTPLHVPGTTVEDEYKGWMDLKEYEESQDVLEGEVGGREGAPVVKQNGSVPEVIKHDEEGHVVNGVNGVKDKARSQMSKEERKKAKKARRLEEKRRLAGQAGNGG